MADRFHGPGAAPVKLAVAVLDDYQNQALLLADWSCLASRVAVEVFSTPADSEDALVSRLQPFEVVVAMRERTAFPERVLARLPRLRLLVSTGTSNAAIDLAACNRLGITTAAAAGRGGLAATAEMTWALVLALQKQLVSSHQALREGRWQPGLARALEGKTLGLVGLGKIGARVARIGQAFGMSVVAWSPNLTQDRADAAGALAVAKLELFERADIVSLHLVLSDRTRHIVGAAELARMRATACIVNTSRAPLIDESALVEALQRRQIAGAGLDVHWQEPVPTDHPLCGLDNVVMTPHLGYATHENMAAFYRAVVDGIEAWLEGEAVTPLAA